MRFVSVVLTETPAYFAGRDANDGIGGGVVGRLSVEDEDTERALLERLGAIAERVLDDALKEEPAALAGPEERTVDQPTQLGVNLRRSDDVDRLRGFGVRFPVVVHSGLSHPDSTARERITSSTRRMIRGDPYRKEL